MLETPTIIQTPARITAVIRLKIPRSEIQAVMGPGICELMTTVGKQGIKPTGPWFSHHFKMQPDIFDFEIGVPVRTPVKDEGRVTSGSLPATTAARTVYQGPYEGLGAAWAEFGEWIKASGHTAEPFLWETYLVDPSTTPDPKSWRTELTRPLVK